MIIHLKLNCLQSYYKYGGDKINYNYNSNFFFFENPIIIVTKQKRSKQKKVERVRKIQDIYKIWTQKFAVFCFCFITNKMGYYN